MKITITFLLLLFTHFNFAQTTMSTKPKVIILTTGGTIASINGQPIIDGPALIQAVPTVLDYAMVEVEEFSKIGSSQMTPAHWLRLAKKVNELFKNDEELTGIIITHGTDTMEETAFFLNLTVKSKKPVILVGAMRSANEISADGPANLINAVRVAIHSDARDKGVLLVLNENIAAARNVWKTDNRRVNTFHAPDLGFLGFADPDKIIFYQSPLRPHTYQTDFDVSELDSLPKVEIVQDYTDFDPAILTYFLNKKIDGLIVQTFAGGRASAGVRKGLEKEKENGIPVVIASSVPSGRIIGGNPYSFPAVFSNDFRGKKARILLMLALTKTKDLVDVQSYFDRY